MEDESHQTTSGVPLFAKVHPLMTPEKRRALWQQVQAVWNQPADECIAEIEESRNTWDRSKPLQ